MLSGGATPAAAQTPNQASLEYDPMAFPGQPVELTVQWSQPLAQAVQMHILVLGCSGFSWCSESSPAGIADWAKPRHRTFTMNVGQTEHTVTIRAAEDGERHIEIGTVTVWCPSCVGNWIAPVDATYRGGDLAKHALRTQQTIGTSGSRFSHPILIDPTRYWDSGHGCSFAPATYARDSNFNIQYDGDGLPIIAERYVWCGEYSYLLKNRRTQSNYITVLSAPNNMQTLEQTTDYVPVDEPTQEIQVEDQPAQDEPVQDEPTPTDDVPAVQVQVQVDSPQSNCITSDQALMATVEGKTRDPWNGARPDLLDMFQRVHATLQGDDGYTTADIRARPDKQGAVWQANGPNALWQSIYAELDQLQACREG